MAVFDFPNTPAVGDVFTDPTSGAAYKWNGYAWMGGSGGSLGALVVQDAPPTSPADNSLWYESDTGMLFLRYNDGNSSQWVQLNALPSGAGYATIPYVNSSAFWPNRIINGDMCLDQRNAGASGTAGGYTADRWQFTGSVSNKGTWQRLNAGAAGLAMGFPFYLSFTSSSAYTPGAAEGFAFFQPIEAYNTSDFAWGTPGAQPVTLSFWVASSLTGTFGGSIRNLPGPSTRCYPFTYTIPVASTWTKISVTIPGDTAGTWVTTGNAGSMQLLFDLGSGATIRAPAGAWASGSYYGANGTVNVVSTNAATFSLTGVKLELGSIATAFPQENITKKILDCQRYYATVTIICRGANPGGTSYMDSWIGYPVQMRAIPTVAEITVGSIYNLATRTAANPTLTSLRYEIASGAAVGDFYYLNGILSLNAEL